MLLGKLPVPVHPTNFRVGQGPFALAVGSDGDRMDIFFLSSTFSFLSPSLWETTRN